MTFHISFGEIDVVVLHYRVPDGAGPVHVNVCYKVNLEAGSLLDDANKKTPFSCLEIHRMLHASSVPS
jgi:hypothetical protein